MKRYLVKFKGSMFGDTPRHDLELIVRSDSVPNDTKAKNLIKRSGYNATKIISIHERD